MASITDAERQDRLQRYQEDLPENREKAWKLLKNYSKLPPDQIEAHLRSVRDRAWQIYPYVCIGTWRFLDLYVTTLPVYPSVVDRLLAGDRLLDAGCCFGYVLRQLVADGVPASHLVGTDLQQGFIDLGYELFRDRDTFGGRFVVGDMLLENDSLASLDGSVDIVHAASFFHLFSWEDQVRLGTRVVRFFREAPTEAEADMRTTQPRLLFGRQIGIEHPEAVPLSSTSLTSSAARFHHNPETLQQLWDEIGQRTGTRWIVEARLVPVVLEKSEEKGRCMIEFAIHKS